MGNWQTIISREFGTVVADISEIKNGKKERQTWYQSEQELEKSFINLLKEQGYEYLEKVDNNIDLKANLRKQIELLNDIKFTDVQWNDLFKRISGSNKTIEEKTRIIQEERVLSIKLDDGTTKNIKIIDAKNIHENKLQVINQYKADNGSYKNRYDVTILVNGLPLVHIELKRRGVNIKEAFNQIKRYQTDSFWSDDGLFEFVQIFVISNGTETKYYSNTTRKSVLSSNKQNASSQDQKTIRKNMQSFEFTSYWTDEKNTKIGDLMDFGATFFQKQTILNILTKYCVFDTNKTLLVMRPYQITAAEKIMEKIIKSKYLKTEGTAESGGYIWHTTGSGKTLTSFKTAELAQNIDDIEKVIFVVDRRDLDYQTIREYKRFASEFAQGVTNSKELGKLFDENQFEGKTNKVFVVTIQKLSNFIKENKTHSIYNKKVVFIFDECHRSQFGEMHKRITKAFKKYYLFGFTGTPIFETNSNHKLGNTYKTTEMLFGELLHQYTIVDAIKDGNVLPFRIDYVNSVKEKKVDKSDKKQEVNDIEGKSTLQHPERIRKIVSYILENYDRKTKTSEIYDFKIIENINEIIKNKQQKEIKEYKRLRGFNSLFAVDNIELARLYYDEFLKQIKEKNKDLKIATIFTYAANQETSEYGEFEEEDFENSNFNRLSGTDREFLQKVINDYNQLFNTTYNLKDSDSFQNFYKNVSLRMKNREIDILIVVNMFLTGFDSTTLNTLWVDKTLRQHGLVQAFSRTNRILNSVKTYGNIVTFRDLSSATDDALALFGNKDVKNIALLRPYEDYINGYEDELKKQKIDGYVEITNNLKLNYPLARIEKDNLLLTSENQKQFINLFGKFLKLRNILSSFDQFEKDKDEWLDERSIQDYTSHYLTLSDQYKRKSEVDKESIYDDVVFEIELVRQDEINVDYILKLINKRILARKNANDIEEELKLQIESSPSLRDKKELIFKFIQKINTEKGDLLDLDKDESQNKINEKWEEHTLNEFNEETNQVIEELNLKKEETFKYMWNSLENGEMKFQGPELGKALNVKYSFGNTNPHTPSRTETRIKVFEKLKTIFDKFLGLIKLK